MRTTEERAAATGAAAEGWRERLRAKATRLEVLASAYDAGRLEKVVRKQSAADLRAALDALTAAQAREAGLRQLLNRLDKAGTSPFLEDFTAEAAAICLDYRALSDTPLTDAAREGWVLVPVVPTEEMIAAGWIDKEDVDPDDIYAAMLAAAPSPEASPSA